MILWRVLPWAEGTGQRAPGGALHFPRAFQGRGRHDNPARYGCLYAATEASSAVAEALARFRGSGPLSDAMLGRQCLPLAIARLELPDDAPLVDLDDPRVLRRERLRPSGIATHARSATQEYAARLFDEHGDALGLCWWSTLESTWINVTLFDRASPSLTAGTPERLAVEHDAVAEAAEFLGLA